MHVPFEISYNQTDSASKSFLVHMTAKTVVEDTGIYLVGAVIYAAWEADAAHIGICGPKLQQGPCDH